MNRIITYLMAGFLFCFTYSTAQTVTFSIGNQTVDPGQQFCVPVKVTNFNQVGGFQFTVNYDPSVLRLQSTSESPTTIRSIDLPDMQAPPAQTSFGIPKSALPSNVNSNVPDGKITVLWTDNTFTGVTRADGTTIFEICFTVLQNPGVGSTQISFSNSPLNSEVFDPNFSPLTFNGQPATITINGGGGGGPTAFKLSMSDETVQQGQQVCVDVTADGFQDILLMDFSIQFDPAKLQFVSVTGFNLAGLSEQNFGLPGQGGVPSGRITCSWNEPTTSGLSIPNGTIIFQICFNAIGSGTSTVSFGNTPLAIDVRNSGGQTVLFDSKSSTVTISGGGGGPTAFKLSMSDETVQQGQQVCVDVTADGFQDILLMDFSIQFDPAKLQFVSVTGFNLAGLSEQNFGLPGQGGVPSGRITCSWNEPTTSGLSIPNGTIIFQICFNAIGSGTSTVSFGNTPLAIDVRNSGGQTVLFDSKSSTVTISGSGGGGGNSDTFRLLIEDKTAATGTQVCVNVTTEGFNDIISWQFHLTYDPAKLQFVSVGNFNASLPGLNDESITVPGEGIVQPGRIVCGWDSSNGLGVTLPDGTAMFQLCFNVLASTGTASVAFSDDQLPFEARKSNGDIVPFNSKNGTITISSSGGGGGTFKLSISNETVQSGQQVCLDVTADNMTNILGVSTSFSYDPSKLQFVSTQGVNLPSSIIFGTPNAPQQPTSPGTITLVWFDESLASITRPNGTVLFQLCFNALGANGTTATVNFTDTPTDIVVSDKNEQSVPFMLQNGTVTIGQAILSLGQPVVTNVNCFGLSTGGIDLVVQGGSGNFRYNWSNGATTQDLLNIPAGNYSVTVTDNATNQTATASYPVTQPTAAITIVPIVKNVDCINTNTGSISLTVNGGTSPYTYNWSGSLTDNVTMQSNLPVGQYVVTVMDSKGCTLFNSFEVGAPSPIVIASNVTEATAGASNGAIALTVNGGNSPYRYNWSNNRTTANINNLAAGEYCVTVTDDKNCTAEDCFVVPEQAIPLAVTNIQIKDVTCSGGNDGSLTFEIQGGRMPYTVVFGDGTSVQNSDGNITKNNLRGGNINFTVTDGAGATVASSATIQEPAPINITSVSVVHDNEESGCTGRITITLAGGNSDYLVQWNAPNTGTGTQIINLCEGTFVPTVRDGKGCIQTFSGITVNTFKASGQVTNAKCPQDQNGKIKLSVSGGATPYSTTWRNANGDVISNTDSLVNVAPGVYTARVSEQSGNVLVRQFTVGSTSNLMAEVEVISDYNGADISCPNASDGIIEAMGRSGEGSYTYQWRREGVLLNNTSPVLNGAIAGTYEVIITDGIGCQVNEEIAVIPPDTIQITANIREVSCIGNKDGEIIVSAIGGAEGRPYNFSWGNAATGPRLSFLAPGTYTVSVTDANNCTVSTAFTLEQPKPIQVQVQTEPASDGCNGKATAVVEGGTPPFTYQWNSFPNQNQQTITNLCPGPYFVIVTDARGCSTPDMVRGLVEDDRYPCIESSVVLTPNDDGGDGLNDEFRINCIEELSQNHLEVYNRWGQLVFEADNYDNTWKGTAQNGDMLPEGPYYYVIDFVDADGNLVQRKGSITILRDN